jgi:hypothetical protein
MIQAFIDCYYAVGVAFVILIPLVWLFQYVDLSQGDAMMAH